MPTPSYSPQADLPLTSPASLHSRWDMEAHAQSVDDTLVDGLSFKLKNGAKYVTERR